MQRRTAASSSSSGTSGSNGGVQSSSSSNTTSNLATAAVSPSKDITNTVVHDQHQHQSVLPVLVKSKGSYDRQHHPTTCCNRIYSCIVYITSTQFLLLVAAVLTIITWILPHQDINIKIQEIEKEIYNTEQQVERLLINKKIQERYSGDSNPKVSTKWVDGEKLLKKELLQLLSLQEQGLELGVPVLTRWVNPIIDNTSTSASTTTAVPIIPAWVKSGDNIEEWQKLVTDAYIRMDQEEILWKENVQSILQQRKKEQEEQNQ